MRVRPVLKQLFDESLVLLKRLLGVPIGEVYAGYFNENTGKRTQATAEQKSMINEVSYLDGKLYRRMHSKLETRWSEAKADGGEAQLKELKAQAKKVDPACERADSSVCPIALRTSPAAGKGRYMDHLRQRGLD